MDPDPLNLLIQIPLNQIFGIILLFLFLLCSALISGSEVALFSLTPSQLETNTDNKYYRSIIIIRKLLAKPKKLLATILVANNFINIAIVLLFDSLGGYFLHDIDTILWGWLPVRFFIEVILVTFLILLFGEILPKIYANRNNLSFAAFMAYPLQFLNKILFFINAPMRYVTLKIHNQFENNSSEINVSHLSHALEVTSEDTSTEEKRILEGIVSFGNTEVRQVMKQRMDVFALSNKETFQKAISLITENGYSRVPVYEESLDKVTGVLYVKDLLPHLNAKDYDWLQLIRKPMFVPENKKLDDLLTEIQEKKNHLAIVVDEYGGTSGLVSLDDIIGEIVGDISDEYDDDDLVYTKINDYNYIFEGRTHLKDFYKVTKLTRAEDFEKYKGEAETLAGFLLEISNKFPRKGDKIAFESFVFSIESIDRKRIKQIKFTINNAV